VCTFVCCLCVLSAAVFFSSCSLRSEASSLTAKLDAVDALISQGQTEDALKSLRQLKKNTYRVFDCIGVYRRFMQLGELDDAEKILVHGLEKNKHNVDLSAVYAHFLMRSDRFAEAEPYAAALAGTKYESIYSELQFRTVLAAADDSSVFLNPVYIPLYVSAYKVSQDTRWLHNGVSLQMMQGDFASAAAQFPAVLPSARDAYFWALVMYDCEKYAESARCLDQVEDYCSFDPERMKGLFTKTAVLRSDLYIRMGDEDAAETEREKAIRLGSSDPSLYVNSAFWAEKHHDMAGRYEKLKKLISEYPDYAPGLIAYGRYAYQSSIPYDDDEYTRFIREHGLQTMSMQAYDNIPKVTVVDALALMDESLGRTKTPLLNLARLALVYKTEPEVDRRVQLADMWRLLEANEVAANVYPEHLLHYALHFLLMAGKADEAAGLFKRYLTAKYSLQSDEPLWDQLVDAAPRMGLWEAEYCAWFAALELRRSAALRLHEYAVYESSPVRTGANPDEIAPFVSCETAGNLAMLYDSIGRAEKAISLYGLAAGTASDMRLKSELLYRLACVQQKQGLPDHARRSLEYSVVLNPDNERARIKLRELAD